MTWNSHALNIYFTPKCVHSNLYRITSQNMVRFYHKQHIIIKMNIQSEHERDNFHYPHGTCQILKETTYQQS